LFVDAVLWIARTGATWRDLPDDFGNWNGVFQRFRRWAKKGVWDLIFNALRDGPDFEYLMLDATIVRAHQHAAGAKKRGRGDEAIGRSRGGLSTKIHPPGRTYSRPGTINGRSYSTRTLALFISGNHFSISAFWYAPSASGGRSESAGSTIINSSSRPIVLYRDFWHVVAGPDNPLVRRRKVTLADLAHEPWCATPLDTTIGSLLIEAFCAEGLQPPRLRVSSVMSPMLVMRLLERSCLLAVIADTQLSEPV
jgi:hypothetical protein